MEKMEEFNDRLYIRYNRGFNNPHLFGMAQVGGCVNFRVEHTASYADPGMGQRIMGLGDKRKENSGEIVRFG